MSKIIRYDLLARMMAAENFSVVYDPKAETASFEVRRRVLTVPEWQNITRNIHILFIAHEVSHALHTPAELIDAVKAKYGEDRFSFPLLNIVEDIRIEVLIVLKFPKLAPFFVDGYTDLLDKGFWKLPENGTELDHPFEERINLQAKMRSKIKVKFTKEEQEVYDFLLGMRTVDDVVEGYGKVLEILEKDTGYIGRRDAANRLKKAIMNGLSSLSDFMRDEDTPHDKNTIEADQGADASSDLGDVVASAIRAIAKDVQRKAGGRGMSYYRDGAVRLAEVKLKPRSTHRFLEDRKIVSNIITEFQRRQAAMVNKKSRESHTGDIAQNLLHKAKYSDDIFRVARSEPVGKNHGISALIDISGSMSDTIRSVVRRVVMMTDFCDRLSIPYQIFGFTDGNGGSTVSRFYTSSMPKKEREDAINALLAPKFPLDMGGTPLSSCMEFYAGLVKSFRAERGLDLVTSILLTDGGEWGGKDLTNYYKNGVFVETSFPVSLAEMMNKHLRDVGINTIHHHVGSAAYPFTCKNWNAKMSSGNMKFSKPDEIFDLRIHEVDVSNASEAKAYAQLMAETINNRN